MGLQQEDLRILGLHKRPPVIRELRSVWLFIRNWPVIPIAILALLILSGLLADVLATQDPRKGGIRDRHIPPAWTEEGTMEHILGTDHSGRDVFTRTLYGARISLAVAAAALLSGFIIGTTLGILSGYAGGWIDEIITRIVDIWQALPFLMVALVCVMIFGQSTTLLLTLMVLLALHPFVRVIRSQTLTIKNQPYVDLARVSGASLPRILIRHILPGVINTAVVIATLSVGSLILAEAALSFLGAGVPAPTPAWGIMVAEARGYLKTAWWPAIVPGLSIFLVVLSLNFMGDWLRDKLDPRLRQI